MKRKIIWSEDASDDLSDIVLYIKEKSSKEIAKGIYQRIKAKIEKSADFPETGRIVPELILLGITDIHEIIESPWRIIYRINEKELQIISVIDGRRNIEELLFYKMVDGKHM